MEGETFRVEQPGSRKHWLDNSGHPHTEAMKITEALPPDQLRPVGVRGHHRHPSVHTSVDVAEMTFLLQHDTELLEHLCESNRDLGRLQEIWSKSRQAAP